MKSENDSDIPLCEIKCESEAKIDLETSQTKIKVKRKKSTDKKIVQNNISSNHNKIFNKQEIDANTIQNSVKINGTDNKCYSTHNVSNQSVPQIREEEKVSM